MREMKLEEAFSVIHPGEPIYLMDIHNREIADGIKGEILPPEGWEDWQVLNIAAIEHVTPGDFAKVKTRIIVDTDSNY